MSDRERDVVTHDSNGKPLATVPLQRRGLVQAYHFRDVAWKEALALNELPPKDEKERLARARALRDLAAVWSDACDRLRILKGKPLPGSLRPAAKPKTRSKSIAAVEVKPAPATPDPPATQPGIDAKPGE